MKVILMAALAALAAAEDPHKHHHPPAPAPVVGGAAVKLEIPDAAVVDQDGKPVKFYSDLVRGKRVAINFIFTTCTTICPPLAATFSKLQDRAGDRLGKDLHLISISVDPVTDQPARLKEWAARFGRRPGWTLVTGDPRVIDSLLKALGGQSGRKEDHTPLALLGDDRGGWNRASGLSSSAKLFPLWTGEAK